MAANIASQHAGTDISSVLESPETLASIKTLLSTEDYERLTTHLPQNLAACTRAGLKQTAIAQLYHIVRKGTNRQGQLEATDAIFS